MRPPEDCLQDTFVMVDPDEKDPVSQRSLITIFEAEEWADIAL
jgi:hypothetical protein